MAITVIAGGAGSGKSAYALSLATAQGPRLGFIATRLPLTTEQQQECARLRAARHDALVTWEEPVRVPDLAAAHLAQLDALVVDDAAEWLENLGGAGVQDAGPALDALCAAAEGAAGELILVADSSNEDRLAALQARATRVIEMRDGLPVRVR